MSQPLPDSEAEAGLTAPAPAARPLWQRLIGPALILVGLALFFALDLGRFLSLDALAAYRDQLRDLVAANIWLAGLGYVVLYALAVAISVPGALWITITGGFLFGTWIGGALTVVGATIGAIAIFLAARTALADLLRAKAGPWLAKMAAGFERDGFSYMLVLRLVPLFPFFIVNIVPAFLGVRLRDYALATFLGIIPGSLVYAGIGAGIGAVIAAGEEPALDIIFQPQVLAPLLGLALLALIPVVYRKLRGTRQGEATRDG